MKISILGTGAVGRALAAKFQELGHEVVLGTRDVNKTLEKKDKGSIAEFLNTNSGIKLRSFAEAAAWAEISLNVTKGEITTGAMKMAGENNLKGKILVDLSNPLDFSKGMPPSLIPELSNTNSLGEELQKLFPGTKVVKTLNTMWNGLMVNPGLINGGNHVNYICGNDDAAKDTVKKLLYEMGWKKESVIDLGDISASRATEATLPIWLRIYGLRKTGAFNFNIVT